MCAFSKSSAKITSIQLPCRHPTPMKTTRPKSMN